MAISVPKVSYAGTIREIQIAGDKGFTLGGETTMPYYTFEGDMPNPARVAIEINDVAPEEWADELGKVWGKVYKDPAAWAKKAQDEFNADLIHLELIGTDPNGQDLGPDHAVDVVKKVLAAIDVPLVVWGSANKQKDVEILKAVCEAVTDKQLIVGPIQDENYKQIGAAALANKHIAVPNSPIDINLAKQLNILLDQLGVPADKMLMDPTVGGLGYGMEYCYSVMERARLAALVQQDDKLQYPLFCNLGREVWKTKEAKLSAKEAPELGDPAKRAILMEAITASAMLLTGGNILVMRHPEAIKLARALMADLVSEEAKMADKPKAGAKFSGKIKGKAAPAKKAAPKPAAKPAAAPEKKAAPKPAAKPAAAPAKKEAPKPAAKPKAAPEIKEAPKPVAKPKEVAKPAVVAAPVAAATPSVAVSSDADQSVTVGGDGSVRIVITTGEDETATMSQSGDVATLRKILEAQQAQIAELRALARRD